MALELKQVADGHTESNLYRLKSIFKTALTKKKRDELGKSLLNQTALIGSVSLMMITFPLPVN